MKRVQYFTLVIFADPIGHLHSLTAENLCLKELKNLFFEALFSQLANIARKYVSANAVKSKYRNKTLSLESYESAYKLFFKTFFLLFNFPFFPSSSAVSFICYLTQKNQVQSDPVIRLLSFSFYNSFLEFTFTVQANRVLWLLLFLIKYRFRLEQELKKDHFEQI